MKNMKKILALLLSVLMIAAMVPAMAADGTSSTNNGSITINSPIIGAKYKAYKVFDMTMNAAGNSFSYTISKSSPFYDAVKAYADVETNGLKLTATSSDPNTFNVSATDAFNAQTFGQALEAGLTAETPTITATGIDPKYETGKTEVTVAKAEAITFEDLALGYYLILSEYPDPYNYVYLEFGTEGDTGYQKWEFTKDSTDAQITAAAEEYAAKTYPDLDSAAAYVAAHSGDFEKAWDEMTTDEKNKVWTDLKDTTKQSAINLIKEKIAGFASDDNVVPITSRLVFVDTTTPDAVINEKNEIHKWDVPVNPEGHADMPDVPDHGEPEGGKNIVVKEATADSPAIYGDWTEANIGDSIHYQLSVNAVNFEQTVAGDPSSVKQIKEYTLADYENKNMHFDTDKNELNVTIVKKNADGTIAETIYGPVNYVAWKEQFFKNDAKDDNGATAEVLTANDNGLTISWVEEVTEAQAATRANVTTTVVDKVVDGQIVYQKAADKAAAAEEQAAIETYNTEHPDDVKPLPYLVEGGEYYLKDAEGNKIPETETHYFASKYPNDVTILVDYWMILDDTAVIDDPGNPNYARYGVNYVEPTDKNYEPVKPTIPEDRKPTSIKEKDDATVYTYALALHKVDQDGNDLAGAKFHIKGLTVTEKAAGWYKVKAFDPDSDTYGDEMETDSKGLLVIEGLSTSSEVTIEETVAPDGFNKLEGTVPGKPEKLSETVTTTASETYYDADGNVVDKKEDAATTTTVINTIENLKKIAIEIENKQGTQLPSTGGMGTTVLYIAGSILVLAAAILLITKRRMSAND